ncbi:MAG: DUF547 domain-containing protein [Deltaproteobacteria bacterium]|nr:DUF547 domain-containing protein [Deltaproteobacteria bacterium]
MNFQKSIMRGFLFYSLFFGLVGFVTPAWSDVRVDNTPYAELLDKYVKNGVADYQGFKNEEGKLDRYLKILEETDPKKLPRNEQFAFYINAYNAWTIKLILSAYPDIKSIKDLGSLFKSPWKKKIARIDGDVMTLDNIEHDILRPRFKDPRIHFAVNCASKGCPPLRSEPYRGDRLDRQLTQMTEAFINTPKYNRIQKNTLYVSSIFKWYSEDFNDDIVGFFRQYAQGKLREEIKQHEGKINVRYLDYDWSLNGK